MKIAQSKSHFSKCSFIDFDVLLLLSYCNLYVLQNYFDLSLELGFSQVDRFLAKNYMNCCEKKNSAYSIFFSFYFKCFSKALFSVCLRKNLGFF